MKASAREERKRQNLFNEIMNKNFPKLGRGMNIKYNEALRTKKRVNPKKIIPRRTMITLSKFKDEERTMKAVTWDCTFCSAKETKINRGKRQSTE